jgi:hypothetical protein
MAENEKKPSTEEAASDGGGGKDSGAKTKENCGSQFQRNTVNKTSFKGRCDELKGYVYDCTNSAKAADMYIKTTREISEYLA